MCVLQQCCQCKNTEYVGIYNHRTDCELLTFNANGNLLQISILTCVLGSAMTIVHLPMYVCMYKYVCTYSMCTAVYNVGVQHHDATLVNVYVFVIP